MAQPRRPLVPTLLVFLALIAAACSSDTDNTDAGSTTTENTATDGTGTDDTTTDDTGDDGTGTTDALTAEERCEANRAAGPITYLSGFDFAASPGIIDIVVAAAEGYFEELCLEVIPRPSAAPINLNLVASGEAQFANAGSFGDVLSANVNAEADLVAVAHYGKTAIQALVVPAESEITSVADLAGTLMGIKGDLPPDIEMMLSLAGVQRGDFEELLLDIFDPVASFELGIDSLPVYKSNEPGQLDAAGFDYRMFDPADSDVPSSFGLLVTSQEFLAAHPVAAEDFVRAAFRGFAFALENPEAAVAHAIEAINASGNTFFLFEASEAPRWAIESQMVVDHTPAGTGLGVLDIDRLRDEAEMLTTIGRFEELPDWESMLNPDLARSLYDGAELIWPA